MANNLQYTEAYNLIDSNGVLTQAIVSYYQEEEFKWVEIEIAGFISPNSKVFNNFKYTTEKSDEKDFTELFNIAKDNANISLKEVIDGVVKYERFNSTKSITPVAQPTPQQVNEQTQKEADKKTNEQAVTEITQPDTAATEKNTPPTLKPTGRDKFAILLNKKRSIIKRTLIPLILGIAIKAGIKYIGTPKVQFPDYCQSPEELRKMIALRNQIVNRLNQIVKIIDTYSKLLTGFGIVIALVIRAKNILNATRKASSIAVKFIPSPPGTPGFVTSLLNDLKDIVEKINTKFAVLAGVVAAVNLSLSLIRKVLLKIIRMLRDLDKYLAKCDPNADLTPLDDNLIALEQIDTLVEETPNESTYNGFIIEVIEEPFSPTINRRRAVAKNRNGIILLSTPLSFTTLPEILIEEIKLLIDSNNLKAD